jgi:hypothetical protein
MPGGNPLISFASPAMAESYQSQETGQIQELDILGSKFCEFCQRLKNWEWRTAERHPLVRYIEHHATYISLCKSAFEGCDMCSLLRRSLLLFREDLPPHAKPAVEDKDDITQKPFCLRLDGRKVCHGFDFGRGLISAYAKAWGPFFQVLGPTGRYILWL